MARLQALDATARPVTDTSPFILMVSGGSDSTALMVMAARGELEVSAGEHGVMRPPADRLHVLHVNHCLRGEASDGDQAFVESMAAELGIGCTVRRVDVARLVREGANLEEAAREVRYGAAWDLACGLSALTGDDPCSARILVAHTADDRAETFLMRSLTGSGLPGLTGMRRARGLVGRPLLDHTRAGLRRYLTDLGYGWREDATNDEDDALRSYVRHHVVPPMVERNPSFPSTLGRSLDVLADEDDYLCAQASELLGRCLISPEVHGYGAREDHVLLDASPLRGAHAAIARRCIRAALMGLLGEEGFVRARLTNAAFEDAWRVVRDGAAPVTLPGGVRAWVDADDAVLYLARAGAAGTGRHADRAAHPVRVPDAVALDLDGTPITWGAWAITAELVDVAPALGADGVRDLVASLGAASAPGAVWPWGVRPGMGRTFVAFDARALGLVGEGDAGAPNTLQVSAPVAGERIRPFGMRGSRLVSDILGEARVPADVRPSWPLVHVVPGRAAFDSVPSAAVPPTAPAPDAPGYEAPIPDATAPGTAAPGQGCCVWVTGFRAGAWGAWDASTRQLVLLRVAPMSSGDRGPA